MSSLDQMIEASGDEVSRRCCNLELYGVYAVYLPGSRLLEERRRATPLFGDNFVREADCSSTSHLVAPATSSSSTSRLRRPSV